MELALFILNIVAFLVVYTLRTIHYLHMFQLNSYKPAQQMKWYRKEIKQCLLSSIPFVLCVILPFIVKNATVAGFVSLVLLLISVFLNFPKKAKKPLVYTKRIIRMLVTHGIFLCVVICLSVILRNSVFYIEIPAVYLLLTPIIILFCNLVNRPVELSINRYYINDAKKMLADHKSLITIGVTGSYGKTSVKYMLGTLLEAKYNVLITPESFNTPLGITKVIRGELRATHDIFVCEMGAKHVGDIKEICDIVHPDHGIITSIGPQHLETFKSLDNVKKTKFELADSLPPGGKLFINGEDENVISHNTNESAISYGLTPDRAYYADRISVTSSGTSFFVNHNGESVEFSTSLIGKHNVINLVGAIAVCCEMGIKLDRLPPYAKKINAAPHRLQLTKRGNTTIIDDAYNSNPSGAKAALDVLSLFDGYKVIITPGMVELGAVQDEENRKFGSYAADVCDFVVLVGKKQTASIYEGLIQKGYDKNKIYVADNLNEAAEKAFGLAAGNRQKIVLFENDLPDNY